MNNYHQRRSGIGPAPHASAPFAIGERVRIVKAPASYGYNGRAGIVIGVVGNQISMTVDSHPSDMHCTTFYAEELERESAS
jgi:hypothetical protein